MNKRGHVKPEGWTPTAPVKDYKATRRANPPAALDWQFTSAVTAIKNQGQCGSCWAFSATEAVESQLVLSSGDQVRIELAPQQTTSCTPSPAQGCNGGFTEAAYEYMGTVTGLTNSFNYPYMQSLTATSATQACNTAKVAAINGPMMQLTGGYAAVSGYHYATTPCTSGTCANQDLAALQAAIETTPVSVCVNAATWNDYTGGVMTSAACGSMAAKSQDHCVMATGFNTTAPTPYWIVRNSWSSTWGEYGYIYLEMAENTCGLADDATIPEVALDLTDAQKAKVAAGRERLYQKAVLAQ
jgi:C1A family cysteine protease